MSREEKNKQTEERDLRKTPHRHNWFCQTVVITGCICVLWPLRTPGAAAPAAKTIFQLMSQLRCGCKSNNYWATAVRPIHAWPGGACWISGSAGQWERGRGGKLTQQQKEKKRKKSTSRRSINSYDAFSLKLSLYVPCGARSSRFT